MTLTDSPKATAIDGAHRRRLYLMRHGSVSYFDPARQVDSRNVSLSETGRMEAISAGIAFAHHSVLFDRVICSGLQRTLETAQRVLEETRQQIEIEIWPAFEELRSGDLDQIPLAELRDAVVGPFSGVVQHDRRFAGGESIGELFDRVLPALERLIDDPTWRTALLVLHGGVNRAILSIALTGGRQFLGNLSQAPACINALDIGHGYADWVVRYIGLAATDLLQASARQSTLERMLEQYIALRRTPATAALPPTNQP